MDYKIVGHLDCEVCGKAVAKKKTEEGEEDQMLCFDCWNQVESRRIVWKQLEMVCRFKFLGTGCHVNHFDGSSFGRRCCRLMCPIWKEWKDGE